jgi:hypothetical protein
MERAGNEGRGRALTAAVVAVGAIERALSGSARALRETTHGVLAAALDRDERAALGVELYESRLGTTREVLAAWEEEWIARDLPRAPARVLIGGAGEGREGIALEGRGYTVGALEPGALAVGRCMAVLSDRAVVRRGTYEELASAVLDGAPSGLDAIAGGEWDAIWLGWTSVMHVLEDRERARLFEACDRICPSGPILATFYPTERARRSGRAHRVGLSIGRAIARARGGIVAPGDAESFGFACGFLRGWTREEMEAHAARVGRIAEWRGDDEGCLRVTLVRR